MSKILKNIKKVTEEKQVRQDIKTQELRAKYGGVVMRDVLLITDKEAFNKHYGTIFAGAHTEGDIL